MPVLIEITYKTDGFTNVSGSRLVKNMQDVTGTGELIWDLNSGVLPDYPANDLEVYANGVRKEYAAEFTILRNTAPGQSKVIITNPLAGVYYNIIMHL